MAKIIKKSSAGELDVRPFSLGEGLDRQPGAKGTVISVGGSRRGRARNLASEGQRRSEEVEREAYQRGFTQGEKAGQALGEQKLGPVLRSFSRMTEEIASLHQALLSQNERFILQMGFLAAAEILHSEVTSRDDVVLSNVRASLEKVVRGSRMCLRVSPHDYKLVEAHLPELLSVLASQEGFSLEADAEILRGGCVLSTEAGDIDAQIDTQLAILRERLLSDQ
jgi:flagellar assembly protein FliH